jgi:hypothetical protein
MPEQKSALLQAQDAMWEAWNALQGGEGSNEVYAEAVAKYEALSKAATEANPEAPCYQNDPDLWNFFSDFHKDFYGIRPVGEYSVAKVRSVMATMREQLAGERRNS